MKMWVPDRGSECFNRGRANDDVRSIALLKNMAFIVMVLGCILAVYAVFPVEASAQTPEPLVAVHVSELTNAQDPTAVAWHYFVAYESLKETLRSDGTPFIVISDSDIASGRLRNPDGSPRYPILISLASSVIADNQISPLREYVSVGGYLFMGSSSFTLNPNGTFRGDFALANEMGLHVADSASWDWYLNNHFTKTADHRLTSHIPGGALIWNAPLTADEIPILVSSGIVIHSNHYAFRVVAGDATVLANGTTGPLLTVKQYGLGQLIFHGALQPLIGHGGYDPGMYSYLIVRQAIEWAFESFRLPIVKVSPWQYPYDAAVIFRHDFEDNQSHIMSIEASAAFEYSHGARGEYYFCTGALRENMGGDAATVASLRRSASNYGATIGSHNGGLRNPINLGLTMSDYAYWHWGPDEALDITPQGYTSGKAYATASILASFQDIEGWLAGVDNGRSGCGAAGTCPRTWASPAFDSTREASREIMDEVGAIAMGEQKIGPFPHRSFSYTTPGKHFSSITLPLSEWYIGTEIAQTLNYDDGYEVHSVDTIRDAVDFYYDLGALINFYGHMPSNVASAAREYVTYSLSKPRIWSTNAVGVHDWWQARSNVVVTPAVTAAGNNYVVTASVSGSTDAATAVEIALPQVAGYGIANLSVLLNGSPANPANYRLTDQGIKVLVGASVTNVMVQYSLQTGSNLPPAAANDSYTVTQDTIWSQASPGVLSNDTDPEGAILTAQLVSGPSHGTLTLNASGSFVYTPTANYVGSDSFTYRANDGTQNSNTATVSIAVTSTSGVLLSDDFTRVPNAPDPLSPWITVMGAWTITNGVLEGSSAPSTYAILYTATTPLWTDYSVSASIQFTTGAFGGGIGGRLNPATGARYSAWIYPDGSAGGANILKLIKFRDWTNWSGTSMQQVSLPSVGTGWHTIKMTFTGSRIQVYYDGALKIDVTDTNFDSRAPYLSGGVSGEMGTYPASSLMRLDNVIVSGLSSVNLPPVAANDAYSTNQNTTLNQAAPGVLSNDTDPEGTTLTAQLVSGPSHGTLTLNANGSFVYTPTAGYAGSDSFTYRANDGTLNSNTATATITITVPNLPPVAANDAYSTNQSTTLNQAAPGVLSNDTDSEGTTLTAELVSGPSHGTLTLNANGSFVYTPTAGYAGSDSFTYRANDGTLNSNTATATITITVPNLPPVAANDAYSTNQSTTLNQAAPGVLSNDTDTEGATLTAQLVSGPSHGTLTLNANGSFVYTPTAGYVGSDSFTYRANDGVQNSNTATVGITVVANVAPVAANDAYSTNQNTTLSQAAPGLLSNDTDTEGATLTAQLVSGPSHGTLTLNANGSFVYTPTANYVGSDSFAYRANDGIQNSNTATVTIAITSSIGLLLSDDFTREPNVPNPLSPWTSVVGAWAITNGVLQGSSAPATYAILYTAPTPLWTDYSVSAGVQFSSGSFGGGLGGRVNPATGARYSAWIYPEGSAGGSNVLKLIKFRDWTNWNGAPMQQVSLPSVGTGWHTLRMTFTGARIQVYFDGALLIDITDNSYDFRAPLSSGGVSGEMGTYPIASTMGLDTVTVSGL